MKVSHRRLWDSHQKQYVPFPFKSNVSARRRLAFLYQNDSQIDLFSITVTLFLQKYRLWVVISHLEPKEKLIYTP